MAVDTAPSNVVIEQIDINLLKPHPRNVEIYGDEDVIELQQSIAESGWVKPLTVTPDKDGVSYLIVGGHRRYRSSAAIGYKTLPVVIEVFTTEEALMERLLRENENRGKTPEQQIREGMTWEPIEKKKAEDRLTLSQGRGIKGPENFPDLKGEVRDIIARRVGLGSGKTYEKGKEVVEEIDKKLAIGDLLQHGELLRMTLNEQSISAASNMLDKMRKAEEKAGQEQKRKEAEQLRQQEEARQKYLEAVKKAEHCKLYHCSVADLSQHVEPESVDYIICDPPYPKEFLYTYSDLARFAAYALKPGGTLLAMSGQSYLPELIDMLSEHLVYHWTACYFTPGPATTLYDRRLATSWKPLLWFTKGEYTGWMNGDVFHSEARDKHAHVWGQSESGMADIIGRFTETGQLICDPFVGGGTTCMVSVNMERRFVGCDIDETCVKESSDKVKQSLGVLTDEQ
jgi:ParB-like chromosome segregation protein Spo0J